MAANLAWWQEVTPLHAASEFYDLDGLRSGQDRMRPFEVDELGDVAGRDLVHLQCHIGTDTVCWARRGARVVGLDFSSNSIEVARRLAAECGAAVEFVCSDVYDAPTALGHRQFDVVYTGIGALNWLPDLDAWARVVHELLRPGGVLYLAEIHPVVHPDAELSNKVTFERAHAIGEVLTAVLETGLTVELLHEHSYTNAPWPWTVRGDDGYFRLAPGWPRYPLVYSVRARKPA
jgi:2-polyprenyl-3-methyl-5-hydroxy-6-metoxy-1,4-benzoquinol methylase